VRAIRREGAAWALCPTLERVITSRRGLGGERVDRKESTATPPNNTTMMGAHRSSSLSFGRVLALAAAAGIAAVLALAGIAASRAGAEDTFRFDNETGQAFTNGARDSVPECWSDDRGALGPQTQPELTGEIRADVGPFEGCGEWWGANLSYDQEFWEEYTPGNDLWKGGVGAFVFAAEDPVVGPATLSCRAAGREWAERAEFPTVPIENEMSSEVDGTTCTVAWLPGAHAATAAATGTSTDSAKYSHFVDSLAPVAAGKARVEVQTFGRRRLGVEDLITLRAAGGRVVGRAKAHLEVGARARWVEVPLDAATRRLLRQDGFLVVRASVRHVDGSAGGGDSTTQLVLRTSGRV